MGQPSLQGIGSSHRTRFPRITFKGGAIYEEDNPNPLRFKRYPEGFYLGCTFVSNEAWAEIKKQVEASE